MPPQDSLNEKIRTLLFQDPEQLYRGATESANPRLKDEFARIFFEAGKYLHETLGDLRHTIYYLERSIELAPDGTSFAQPRSQLFDTVVQEAGKLKTPYDTQSAVATYDDVEEQLCHANLDDEQFFKTTRRGVYRETIAKGMKAIYRTGYSILEAGCAAGGYYCTLRRLLGEINYTGFDTSRMMVERARRHFPNVHYLQASAAQIPFAGDQFDLVLATDVVNFVKEWNLALAELYRVCRRYLVLRLRTLIDNSLPTQVLPVGSRYLRFTYVLFNVDELNRFINALLPKPLGMKILLFTPDISSTLDIVDLAQHHLPTLKYDNGAVALNTVLDLIVVKPNHLQ